MAPLTLSSLSKFADYLVDFWHMRLDCATVLNKMTNTVQFWCYFWWWIAMCVTTYNLQILSLRLDPSMRYCNTLNNLHLLQNCFTSECLSKVFRKFLRYCNCIWSRFSAMFLEMRQQRVNLCCSIIHHHTAVFWQTVFNAYKCINLCTTNVWVFIVSPGIQNW